MSAQLWNALQQSSRRERPTVKLLSAFDSVADAVEGESNKLDLLCPRKECASVILKKSVAKLVEKETIQIEPADVPSHPLLASLPEPATISHWWLIAPSPMQFENIGFSRPVESLSLSPSGRKLKLLACAECDLGPLGWCEEGGTEFFLACSRVGYRDE